MAKIPLANAGDSLIVRVLKCEVVDGASGEQVKFSTEKGEIYVGRKTADRQLLRAGFGEGEGDEATVFYGDVDGYLLKFYRTPNKNPALKPYWNIERAADGDEPVRGKPEAPLAPPKAPAPAKDEDGIARRSAIELAYKRAWSIAVAVQGKLATPDSLQAGAATVFIAYQNNHLLGLFSPAPTAEKAAEKPKAAPAKPAKKAEVPPPSDNDTPDFDGDDAAVELDQDLPF